MTKKTKAKLPVLTLAKIREWEPCYDPIKWFPENWKGTIGDILRDERIPVDDRIWAACYALDDKQARLFAVWCAREALKLAKESDPRSVNACDVAERFANSNATSEELDAARDAAWDAARDAAWTAAWDAAWTAAWAAAQTAARAAARTAAWAAARDAAWDAAWTAAWAAAQTAARAAARTAARDAAWDAAREKQLQRLIEVVELLQHV